MAKKILVAYGIDVDAVAGWLGSYGGEDSPDDISRGLFAGEVGSIRLLDMFDKYKLKTTWFIPGHSVETFPEQMKEVARRGHEIGMHGYSHENPIAMTRAQSGSACVVDEAGRLAGIFTDGDLRRHLTATPDLLARPIAAVMTRDPIRVEADQLAVDVLQLFERHKIDDLPVVDARGVLAGCIDIQDLPRLKIL